MLRFLSRRKGRNTAAKSAAPQTRIGAESTRFVPNKNLAQCRVILLDGTDLSVDLTVSPLFFSFGLERAPSFGAPPPPAECRRRRHLSINAQGVRFCRRDDAASAPPNADFFPLHCGSLVCRSLQNAGDIIIRM